MTTRLMLCGDVHLGRRPAGLPADLQEQSGLSARELGPKAALRRAVDEACRRRVDAFVFAGDVVDEENRRFEAYGALREAVERLVEAGIAVHAVAGNHDVDTLPRLARELPGFRLLGEGGHWEDAIVEGSGGTRVALRGWSFPTRRVTASPLDSPRPSVPGDVHAVLGIVHGDLDVAGSHYGPLRTRDLAAEPGVHAWFLGHVHKPSLDATQLRPIGYLGSISGLDRTETGPHGPWLVEVEDSGALRLAQLPLAPLAWVRLPAFDVSAWSSGEAFDLALRAEYERARTEWQASDRAPLAAGFSVLLEGSSAHLEELRAHWTQAQAAVGFDGLYCFVADLEDRAHPRIDLAERARSQDPVGLLAQRILALEDPTSPLAALLVEQGRRAMGVQLRRREFTGALSEIECTDAQLRERLQRSAWRALETLEAERAEQRP